MGSAAAKRAGLGQDVFESRRMAAEHVRFEDSDVVTSLCPELWHEGEKRPAGWQLLQACGLICDRLETARICKDNDLVPIKSM